MKLTELRIENFGRLRERSIILTEGINLIYGPNESGKTTLHTFIRGMFYGLARKRGRASRNDLYSRYEPWNNGSYAGVVRFESGGKIFRLSRNFHKGNTSEELICETDGEKLSVEQGDLQVLMGNVSENAFENTVYIGQLKSRTDSTLYDELRNRIANYEGAGDGSLDVIKAQNLLRTQKKELENRRKAENLKQESQKKELTNKMTYVQEELKNVKIRLTQTEEQIKGSRAPVQQDDSFRIKDVKPIFPAAAVLAAVIFVIAILQSSLLVKSVGEALAALCLAGGVVLHFRQLKKRMDRRAGIQSKPILSDEQKQLVWKQEQLKEQYNEKQTVLQNLQDEYQDFCYTISASRTLDEEIMGIQLAIDTIETISAGMQVDIEKEMRMQISAILKELTKGRYKTVDITQDQNIGLNTEDKYINLEQTSRGTIEQVYFALRMAVGNILCDQEPLPVLLDDVFAMYDEERLTSALHWLDQNKEQTLIFTCHRREEELLKAAGIRYHKIEL